MHLELRKEPNNKAEVFDISDLNEGLPYVIKTKMKLSIRLSGLVDYLCLEVCTPKCERNILAWRPRRPRRSRFRS